MGDYGISVALPTKSITSTEPRDYVMSSKYTSVKILQETFGTVVVAAGGTTVGTVTHNLGFCPLSLIYTETQPNVWQMGFPYMGVAGISPDLVSSQTYVGTSNIIISFNNSSGSQGTARYKIFVMGDSG